MNHPSTPPSDRRSTGNAFESVAIAYLCRQGLTPVMRNYHCRSGEIDAIMKDEQTLVFVEVRYRSHADFISPLESITTRKKQRIIRTARHFLHYYRLTEKVASRIDVIGINGGFQPAKITWIRNAISA